MLSHHSLKCTHPVERCGQDAWGYPKTTCCATTAGCEYALTGSVSKAPGLQWEQCPIPVSQASLFLLPDSPPGRKSSRRALEPAGLVLFAAAACGAPAPCKTGSSISSNLNCSCYYYSCYFYSCFELQISIFKLKRIFCTCLHMCRIFIPVIDSFG